MAKPKSINESLAESLKKAVPSKPVEETARATDSVSETFSLRPVDNAKTVSELPRLARTTISMKPTEQDQVDRILAVLRQCRRTQGGTTDAINIALRLCPLDADQIGRAWDESRAEDGRKKKSTKT